MTIFSTGDQTPASGSAAVPFPKARLAVLVLVPVVVFSALALTALMAIGMVALFSAMGHGSLTREEERPLLIAGGLLTLAGTAAVTLLLERSLFGRTSERSAETAGTLWRTRAASSVLIVLIAAGGPPLANEMGGLWRSWKASRGTADDRWEAVGRLAFGPPSPRAFKTLSDIARDTADDASIRGYAASGLANYPQAMPVVLELTRDAEPRVRAGAGVALVRLADDDASWARLEQLALDDPLLIVREEVSQALAQGGVRPSRAPERERLLKTLSERGGPGEALSAARVLGAAGYDTAMAIALDVNTLHGTRIEAIETLGELKDRRALDLLRSILTGNAPPGLVPLELEERYRGTAAGAIAKISGDDAGWNQALYFEQAALDDVKKVVAAQQAYREALGFFDARLACLELPATCVPGRDRDESLLGPALVSLMPRRGYARHWHPGPAAPRDKVTAARVSASSVTAFAYVAVPEVPFETGLRAFCADDTGQICFNNDGTAPPVREGRCPESAPLPPGFRPEIARSANPIRECRAR